jgi:hypothetical protein
MQKQVISLFCREVYADCALTRVMSTIVLKPVRNPVQRDSLDASQRTLFDDLVKKAAEHSLLNKVRSAFF